MYVIEPMTLDDVEEVVEIEREAFTLTWPSNAYRRELRENRLARYVVLRNELEPVGAAPEPAPEPPEERGLGRLLDRLLHRPAPNGAPRPERPPHGPILGYAGLWLMADEAHITTIATAASQRGKGLGELLLQAMFLLAELAGANQLTLEVRVSNAVAQRLYEKYGFVVAGTRKRYYSDNGEDALIMWSQPIETPEWRARCAELTETLSRRLQQPINDTVLTPLRRARGG